MQLARATFRVSPIAIGLGLVTFFLISSKELLWFRLLGSARAAQGAIALGFFAYFASLFVRYSERTSRCRFVFTLRVPAAAGVTYWLLLAGATCGYLLLHELCFDDGGRSLKYCVYWIFFLTLLTSNVQPHRIARWVLAATLVLSIALMVQSLLIRFVAAPAQFPPLAAASVDGRTDDIWVNPFGLGLVSLGNLVTYGPVSFYRASSFATEPKYCSLILWSGVLCWFFLRACGRGARRVWLVLLAGGLFICHAYVSAAVAVLTLLLVHLGTRLNGKALLALLVLAVGGGLFGLLRYHDALGGYVSQRVSAFLTTAILPTRNVAFDEVGLFGVGFDSPISSARVPAVLLHLIHYGWLGLALHLAVLTYFCRTSFRGLREGRARSARYTYALAMAIVLVYLVLFMPEFITPLFGLVYAIPFLLDRASSRWSSAGTSG